MKLNFVNVVVCSWLAIVGCLIVIQPFLAEPAKTYVGHAMYLTFFAGIGAAMVAFKIRTGSFPSFKPDKVPATSTRENISVALIWIAVFLIAGVGTGSALKYFGWVSDRRVLLFVALCAPVIVVAAYWAYRYVRRQPVN